MTSSKWVRRFERWSAGRPEEPVTTRVVAYLASLTPAGAHNALYALRATLDGSVDWTAVPRVRLRRNEARLRATVLDARERARLARASLSARERALLSVMYVVRRFEAGALRWTDIDLDAGTVYVACGKGERAGWTALPPAALDAVRAWRVEAPESPWVFPSARGGAPTAGTVGRWVRRALRRIGLWHAGRGPHAFRRTFATEFLRVHPAELRRLQVLMRHASISTTTLYDYPRPEDVQAALRGLVL